MSTLIPGQLPNEPTTNLVKLMQFTSYILLLNNSPKKYKQQRNFVASKWMKVIAFEQNGSRKINKN